MHLKTKLNFSLTLISLFITRNVLLDLTMTTICYNLLLHLRTPKSKHDKFLINLIWILNIWVRFPYNPLHLPCMQ